MRVADFANLDIDREERTGIPEIVLAEGKTDAQLRAIVEALVARKGRDGWEPGAAGDGQLTAGKRTDTGVYIRLRTNRS